MKSKFDRRAFWKAAGYPIVTALVTIGFLGTFIMCGITGNSWWVVGDAVVFLGVVAAMIVAAVISWVKSIVADYQYLKNSRR